MLVCMIKNDFVLTASESFLSGEYPHKITIDVNISLQNVKAKSGVFFYLQANLNTLLPDFTPLHYKNCTHSLSYLILNALLYVE